MSESGKLASPLLPVYPVVGQTHYLSLAHLDGGGAWSWIVLLMNSLTGLARILAVAFVWASLPAPHALGSHSDTKPNTVKSWYMNTASASVHFDKGCALGDRIENGSDPANSVVILSYGDPVAIGNGWGTDLPGVAGDVSVTDIRKAVEEFATGAVLCVPPIFRDRLSIWIGMGATNNFPGAWGTTKSHDHGEKWGDAVKSANDNLPSTVAAGAQIWGAYDSELGYSNPQQARAWANGFKDAPGTWPYFYFGAAGGCRTFTTGGVGSCGVGQFTSWHDDDVVYLANNIAIAEAIPQIYREDGVNAEQWVMLSVYNMGLYGLALEFDGVLSQKAACDYVGAQSCMDAGTYNTSTQAWNQMVNKMDARSGTSDDMSASCDIDWH